MLLHLWALSHLWAMIVITFVGAVCYICGRCVVTFVGVITFVGDVLLHLWVLLYMLYLWHLWVLLHLWVQQMFRVYKLYQTGRSGMFYFFYFSKPQYAWIWSLPYVFLQLRGSLLSVRYRWFTPSSSFTVFFFPFFSFSCVVCLGKCQLLIIIKLELFLRALFVLLGLGLGLFILFKLINFCFTRIGIFY